MMCPYCNNKMEQGIIQSPHGCDDCYWMMIKLLMLRATEGCSKSLLPFYMRNIHVTLCPSEPTLSLCNISRSFPHCVYPLGYWLIKFA